MSRLGQILKSAAIIASLGLMQLNGQGGSADAAEQRRGYLCDVDERGLGNWAPKQIGFRFTGNGTKAVVLDGMIEYVHKKPISVTVKAAPGGKRRFRWTLSLPTDSGQRTSVAYRVDFDPKTLKGDLIANVTAFTSGRNGGSLTCKAATFKSL